MSDDTNISGSAAVQNIFYFLGIVGLFTVFCWFAKTIMITFIVSILLVFILNPAVDWLEKHRVRRWMAILVVLGVTLVLFTSVSYLVILKTSDFSTSLPQYKLKILKLRTDIEKRFKPIEKFTSDIFPETSPDKNVREVEIQEPSHWQDVLSYILDLLTHASLIPFIVFFILLDRATLREKLANVFGEKNRASFVKAIEKMQSQMMGFIAGNFLSVLLLWFATYLGFLLVGMDYPTLNSGFFAACNVIPVIGPVIGLVPPLLTMLLSSDSWTRLAWVAGFGMMMHLVFANVLTPKLVGKRVKLNPVAIIIAMMYWYWVWGITGLILAIPMVAFLKTICDFVEPWKPIGKLLE